VSAKGPSDSRPDPDALLARARREEARSRRGALTIFFGAAPGVGKTFAMLKDAAWQRDVERRDVVAGVVETHERVETATLLAGFEVIPKRRLVHRGVALEELDLDAALARKPSLLLVDELAHTNVEGSRHAKRWQDVEELREAGIEVYTTLNVQHVESLNDVVAQITGVTVRETVPDAVLASADEIKLVDLPPDDLLERLRDGKVYVPAMAERALESFFRKGNLIALRELALRTTADRVDADMQAYRKEHGIERTWAASDRLLVCVSPSPYSASLLRVGKRMAAAMRMSWYAVTVETPAAQRLPSADRARITQHLRLAEKLGAETVTLTGERAAEEILRFARGANVTKIVVGKPRARTLRDRLGTPFIDELILGSGDIDIYATAGAAEDSAPPPPPEPRGSTLASYLSAAIVVTLATAASYLLFGSKHPEDVVMTYLLGIVVAATRFGFRAAVASAILSVLCFDYFFVEPFLTFSVGDLRHMVTFSVMLLVAVVIAGLTRRVRDQAEAARRSERRTAVLYGVSRALARPEELPQLLRLAAEHIEDALQSRVAVFLPARAGDHTVAYAADDFAVDRKEAGVIAWVLGHGREAGLGTDTLHAAGGLYLPLLGAAERPLGVLGIYPTDPARFGDPEQRRLADALTAQLAMALERGRLAEETKRARVEVETERMRSTLLSSVSHDLRTPLAVMQGAASMLLDEGAHLTAAGRSELAQAIVEETERLERLIRNLLDMTRLESGAVHIEKEWTALEEVVGAALDRTDARLAGREVTTNVPGELLAPFDAVLIEQVLVNLLENAAKYTPKGSPIEVRAARQDAVAVVEVADRGPGVPEDERERIFDKFHQGRSERTKAGVGLGLAICRAIVLAHGGRVWVEPREGGGAAFKFSIPLEGEPPSGRLPDIDTREEARP
jgi:two-component system, OmpR family, sensor histidine kinase KdpD